MRECSMSSISIYDAEIINFANGSGSLIETASNLL